MTHPPPTWPQSPPPHRILAIDGGGTRGIVALAFLARLERLLAARAPNPEAFRLCDYFDLIGGTSTGAIIAAGLATGRSVAEITSLYQTLAPAAFRRSRLRIPYLMPRYNHRPLARFLAEQFGEATLGSPILRTGFAAVARRYNTGSPWLISNAPAAPYWNDRQPSTKGNRHYRLADIIRASTAAPGFFSPEYIQIHKDEPPAPFVDGGLSPHNDPSLLLLLLIRAAAYGVCWPIGDNVLSLTSIGTGWHRGQSGPLPRLAIHQAWNALLDSTADAQHLTLTLLQFLGTSPAPRNINRELGTLANETLGQHSLLRYQRYDLDLKPHPHLRAMDAPANMPALHALATQAAETDLLPSHFPREFDPWAQKIRK